MPDNDELPKGKTFMWIEPNHPIMPPSQRPAAPAPAPPAKPPMPDYSKSGNRLIRT